MEGETAEKETAEEKEEEEEGLKDLHHQMSTAGSSMDYSGLPIMHWEDLSLRIAELEKQEQQRRERAKSGTGPELRTVSGGREEDRQQELWRATWQEDEGDLRRCCITSVTSRFHNHKNLQLCFINDSDSEEEEGADMKVSTATGSNGYHPSGLKQEVAAALRALRDKALAEQKETECLDRSSVVTQQKHLERCELNSCSLQQLTDLKTSLQHDIHGLSSELVAHLVVRDQLRTKQDAMLLDVQDLT